MSKAAPVDPFPEASLKSMLDSFWDEQMGPPLGVGGGMFSLGDGLDSLTACTVIAAVEDIVGLSDMPETLVQKGGYKSKDEFREHLFKRVRSYWDDKKE